MDRGQSGRVTYRVELLLKLLVGVVDAELLKAVHLERLEAADSKQRRTRQRKVAASPRRPEPNSPNIKIQTL